MRRGLAGDIRLSASCQSFGLGRTATNFCTGLCRIKAQPEQGGELSGAGTAIAARFLVCRTVSGRKLLATLNKDSLAEELRSHGMFH